MFIEVTLVGQVKEPKIAGAKGEYILSKEMLNLDGFFRIVEAPDEDKKETGGKVQTLLYTGDGTPVGVGDTYEDLKKKLEVK